MVANVVVTQQVYVASNITIITPPSRGRGSRPGAMRARPSPDDDDDDDASFSARDAHPDAPPDLIARADAFARAMVDAARRDADEVRSIHWSPYDRVGVVNADP